jgi:hypothetical protein
MRNKVRMRKIRLDVTAIPKKYSSTPSIMKVARNAMAIPARILAILSFMEYKDIFLVLKPVD